MSQATTGISPRAAGRKWPRWLGWLGWTLLGLLTISACVAFFTLQFGAVHGVEFNPYSFARRSYSLYEIPVIRWQVRGVRREDVSGDAEKFLGSQNYVSPPANAPNVWHIVVAARGTKPPRIGDADILVRYLEAQNHAGQPAWVEWSEQNPQLAKALWPAIGRLAQEELYVFVPDFFELARATSDPVLLQKGLNENLAEQLFQLAKRMQEREEQAEAKRLLEEAARLDAKNPLIRRAREMAAAQSPPVLKK